MDPIYILVICAVCVFWLGIKTQNRLTPLRERVNEATANVKACIQKRDRLIKQLIEVASNYAKHEKELHQSVSADFNAPNDIDQNPRGALIYVSRLVNAFPDLRADRTYLNLSNQLSTLESELAQRFEQHSASVRNYNSVRLSFPNDMFFWFGGFGVAEHLDGTESLSENEKPIKKTSPAFVNNVPNPRVGMKFRDTKDNWVYRVVEVRTDGWMGCQSTPESEAQKGGTSSSGSTEMISLWKERIADGRYQLE